MAGQMLHSQQQTLLGGQTVPVRPAVRGLPARRCSVTVRAEQEQAVPRRAAVSLLAGAAALLNVKASEAAFGDAANVFGKFTGNTSGTTPYKGDGFSVNLPSKWNPSKERETPGIVLRYEDNGDNVNNVVITRTKAGKGSVTEFGDPAKFLQDYSYLLGKQVWTGETISEGGFKKNSVSNASLIDSSVETKNGRPYYKMQVLTRTADGNEGGRHNLITATVGGGQLWICKVQIGDKRWFKGASKDGMGVYNTFTVA